ncbi:hypothetical protein [Paramylibacter kogurei]|nr:hypothetical protein [Amylibacter kogurei]
MPWYSPKPVICLFAITLVASCDPRAGVEQVDLVPERAPGSQGANGFCKRDDLGLYVMVRNQSNIDALQSTITRVTFGNTSQDLSTPPIAAGSMATVGPYPIPSGCFNADCDFTIHVNQTRLLIDEFGDNNSADGICIG